MSPRLPSGALIVARPLNLAAPLRVGDVVVARRPDRPELEIINPDASTDSRQFGPVPRDHIVAQVRWRYWPLPPIRV